MPIVLITWHEPVQYSTNNGFSLTEYDPGQLYDVPPHVAAGMVARNWARYVASHEMEELLEKLAGKEDAAGLKEEAKPVEAQREHEPAPEQPPAPPVTEPDELPPLPKVPPDENGDDDDDGELVKKQPKRSRSHA